MKSDQLSTTHFHIPITYIYIQYPSWDWDWEPKNEDNSESETDVQDRVLDVDDDRQILVEKSAEIVGERFECVRLNWKDEISDQRIIISKKVGLSPDRETLPTIPLYAQKCPESGK